MGQIHLICITIFLNIVISNENLQLPIVYMYLFLRLEEGGFPRAGTSCQIEKVKLKMKI